MSYVNVNMLLCFGFATINNFFLNKWDTLLPCPLNLSDHHLQHIITGLQPAQYSHNNTTKPSLESSTLLHDLLLQYN